MIALIGSKIELMSCSLSAIRHFSIKQNKKTKISFHRFVCTFMYGLKGENGFVN